MANVVTVNEFYSNNNDDGIDETMQEVYVAIFKKDKKATSKTIRLSKEVPAIKEHKSKLGQK